MKQTFSRPAGSYSKVPEAAVQLVRRALDIWHQKTGVHEINFNQLFGNQRATHLMLTMGVGTSKQELLGIWNNRAVCAAIYQTVCDQMRLRFPKWKPSAEKFAEALDNMYDLGRRTRGHRLFPQVAPLNNGIIKIEKHRDEEVIIRRGAWNKGERKETANHHPDLCSAIRSRKHIFAENQQAERLENSLLISRVNILLAELDEVERPIKAEAFMEFEERVAGIFLELEKKREAFKWRAKNLMRSPNPEITAGAMELISFQKDPESYRKGVGKNPGAAMACLVAARTCLQKRNESIGKDISPLIQWQYASLMAEWEAQMWEDSCALRNLRWLIRQLRKWESGKDAGAYAVEKIINPYLCGHGAPEINGAVDSLLQAVVLLRQEQRGKAMGHLLQAEERLKQHQTRLEKGIVLESRLPKKS